MYPTCIRNDISVFFEYHTIKDTIDKSVLAKRSVVQREQKVKLMKECFTRSPTHVLSQALIFIVAGPIQIFNMCTPGIPSFYKFS